MVYKHPSLQKNTFTNDIILPLLEKLNKKNSKKIFLLGDFTVDLLQYETSEPVSYFVDTLSSNSLSPFILPPTKISNSSSTLINNIFCNSTFNSNIISVNTSKNQLFLSYCRCLPKFGCRTTKPQKSMWH